MTKIHHAILSEILFYFGDFSDLFSSPGLEISTSGINPRYRQFADVDISKPGEENKSEKSPK
jgi:hypothetical protein